MALVIYVSRCKLAYAYVLWSPLLLGGSKATEGHDIDVHICMRHAVYKVYEEPSRREMVMFVGLESYNRDYLLGPSLQLPVEDFSIYVGLESL